MNPGSEGAGTHKSTIKEVAKAAGVSISSVSRVINGYPGVHPSLHARVMRAVAELNYVIPAERVRQHRRSKVLYFILANRNLHIPFHSKILQAIENKCAERKDLLLYRSLRYSEHAAPEDINLSEILNLSSARDSLPADGLILTGTTYPNFLEALRKTGIPFVLLGNN